MNYIMILPFNNGSIQFPGLAEDEPRPSFSIISYAPPPAGAAPYVLAEISTTQANVDILSARPDCLYMSRRDEEGYVTETLPAQERNAVRAKIAAMGFTGAAYGLLNAAIQASQNRADLVVAIGTKAFFRNVDKEFMNEAEVRGGRLG